MAVDDKRMSEILADFSRHFPTCIEVVPNRDGTARLYAREGTLYATARILADGTISHQTRERLELSDPLIKATCCNQHAACFMEDRNDPTTGVCVYCAPLKSVFRLRPGRRDRAIQAATDEALVASGVQLDPPKGD